MIWLLIVLFLTWDPFTLVLNYMNPCECFCYKYSSCFLMCDMNFYDHRITIISLLLSKNLYSPFDKRNSEVFCKHTIYPSQYESLPSFYKNNNTTFQINCPAKESLKSHLGTSHKHSKKAKFCKSHHFSTIKYTLLYAIDEFP